MQTDWTTSNDTFSYNSAAAGKTLVISTNGEASLKDTQSGTSVLEQFDGDNISTAPKALLEASAVAHPSIFDFVMRQSVKPVTVKTYAQGLVAFFSGDIAYFGYTSESLTESELAVHDALLRSGIATMLGQLPNVKYVIDTKGLEL